MAEPDTPDLIGYEALAQDALRAVVRKTLDIAASPQGLPGAHHLYVSFATTAPGVSIPPDLLARYPEEMTIVLQHQFWDLSVEAQGFAVTLKFGGSPKRMAVPYAAVTRFYDPSVAFMLEFAPAAAAAAPPGPPAEVLPLRAPAAEGEAPPPAEPGEPAPSDGPKIVSLDQFRKK